MPKGSFRLGREFDIDIKEKIRNLTLFSPELVDAYRNKEFTAYTLEALSVIELDDKMFKDMRIDVEEWRGKPDDRRGSRFDVLISFPSHRINIEIQKLRNNDEINRATFYMGKIATDIRKGLKRIPFARLISIWICDFNPFKNKGIDLPYYCFESCYKPIDGIVGIEETFSLGNGVEYIFINSRFNWSKVEKERPLTDKENTLKNYIEDMKEANPENVKCQITKDVLYSYKEGGDMYDKVEMILRKENKEAFRKMREVGKNEGRAEGIAFATKTMTKAMLKAGFDVPTISKITGLTEKEILDIAK